jgi:hypothetical protein
MVVSGFTMTLGHPGAAKALIVIVVACGLLEYFWIQVVYDRFPILREDEMRRGKGKIALSEDDDQEDRHVPKTSAWKDEIAIWREFASMPIFFSGL